MFNRIYKKTLLKKVISVFMVSFICTNLFIIKPKKTDAFVAEAIGLGLTMQTILDFATVAIGAGCILNNMDELVYMGKTMYKNFSKLFVRDKATSSLTVPADVVPAVNKFVSTYDYSSDSYLSGNPTIINDVSSPSLTTYQKMIKSIDLDQDTYVPDTLSFTINIEIPENYYFRNFIMPIGNLTFNTNYSIAGIYVKSLTSNAISRRELSTSKFSNPTLYLKFSDTGSVYLCIGDLGKNSSSYYTVSSGITYVSTTKAVLGEKYSFTLLFEKDFIETFMGTKFNSVSMNSVINYNSSVSLPVNGSDIIINTNSICADGTLFESPDNIYDLPIKFPLTNENVGDGVITVPGDVVVPPGDIVVPPDVVVPGENTGLIGEIAQGVRSIADSIVDGFSGVLDGMSSFADSVVDTVSDIFVPPVDSTSEIDFSPLYISLQNKFPFCLPFDFINIINDFNSEVHEPIFYVNMNAFNYKNNARSDVGFYIDFTEFEKLFKILRYFILISFIVFIIFVTRKIIGG